MAFWQFQMTSLWLHCVNITCVCDLIHQVASSVLMVLGVCKASLPCRAHSVTTLWRTWMWSSQTQISWPLTWTSYSRSSWSLPPTACGTRSATRRPCALCANAWMSRTLVLRASCCSRSTAAAPTTSLSWWSSSRAALGQKLESSFTQPINSLDCLSINAYCQRIDGVM